MEDLVGGSVPKSTLKTDVLSKLLMESERLLNIKIIRLIEEQECSYIDDFFEIDTGTWCLYFSCKHDNMYQISINSTPKSDEYGVIIYNLDSIKVAEMLHASSLITLMEDPDVGIHTLLYNS